MARKATHRHTLSTSSTAPIASAAARSSSAGSTKEPAGLKPKPSARIAEVAGGTAAECAAVCCCCPFGLAGLLFCALVRLPAGLCRRAIVTRKRKRKIARKKSALLALSAKENAEIAKAKENEEEKEEEEEERWVVPAESAPSPELEEMEREMWARFYGAGFWRSPSQREDHR